MRVAKITEMTLSSVTRWLDYFVFIWQLTKMKMCPTALIFSKISFKVSQILDEHLSTGQGHFNFHQSGEISSNLVTLSIVPLYESNNYPSLFM